MICNVNTVWWCTVIKYLQNYPECLNSMRNSPVFILNVSNSFLGKAGQNACQDIMKLYWKRNIVNVGKDGTVAKRLYVLYKNLC